MPDRNAASPTLAVLVEAIQRLLAALRTARGDYARIRDAAEAAVDVIRDVDGYCTLGSRWHYLSEKHQALLCRLHDALCGNEGAYYAFRCPAIVAGLADEALALFEDENRSDRPHGEPLSRIKGLTRAELIELGYIKASTRMLADAARSLNPKAKVSPGDAKGTAERAITEGLIKDYDLVDRPASKGTGKPTLYVLPRDSEAKAALGRSSSAENC